MSPSARGMRWCKRAVKEKRLYITKVDKGGCILILQAEKVDEIMLSTLQDTNQFDKEEKDPRDKIKKLIKRTIKSYHEKNLLSQDDMFAITGVTAKGGMSHGHENAKPTCTLCSKYIN